jgi:hypothetical protein
MLIAAGICAATLATACTGNVTATLNGASVTAATTTAQPTAAATDGTSAATPAKSDTGTPSCHTADLSAAFGAKKSLNTPQSVQGELGALDHEEVALVYTNISGHDCTMDGFGGMDLYGPSLPPGDSMSPPQGPVFSAKRSGATPTSVLLHPGDTAHLEVAYLVSTDRPAWVPTRIAVTPPNETTQLGLNWTVGDAVLLYDGGQNWGPTISPVLAGAQLR